MRVSRLLATECRAAQRTAVQRGPQMRGRGLIFGLIHLRSFTFIGIRIGAVMQVTDVNGIQRTIIQTTENRKVGGSTRPRATGSGQWFLWSLVVPTVTGLS
jgi:hypothetical protein